MEVVVPNIGELDVVINSRNANQVGARRLLCSTALDIHLTGREAVSTGKAPHCIVTLTRRMDRTAAGPHRAEQCCERSSASNFKRHREQHTAHDE